MTKTGAAFDWREVMPEADRAVYRAAGYGGRTRPGERPAVLVVDVTYQFVGRRLPTTESMREYPSSAGMPAWQAVEHIARLIAAARDHDVLVIYTVGGAGRSLSAQRRHKHPNATDQPRDANQIVEEVAPSDDDIVLSKARPSAFYGTPLLSALVDRNIDTVIVTGGTTSGCVRATVMDAFSNGYSTLVPEDGVFDRGRLSHAVSLFEMDQKYADVVSTDAATAYLSGEPPTTLVTQHASREEPS
ncbi:MAG: isochorismatase family protein [Streptosporangiales bacterium]|nr:isochorismatase family protein [Streptosporangiales bacterium]